MAFVSTQGPTVVDQTTLMKKYLQFVAALTDANTRKSLFSLGFLWLHPYEQNGANRAWQTVELSSRIMRLLLLGIRREL